MLKKSMLLLSGLALWTMAGTAGADDEDARIKSMSYSTLATYGSGVINVYSSDGQQWDTFSGPPLKFGAIMHVEPRWPGYVRSMAVLNGYCVDAGCANNPVIYVDEYVNDWDLHLNRVFEIAMDDIPITDDEGIATIPLGDEILQECNNHLSVNGATLLYTFNRSVTTSFSVNTRKSLLTPGEFPEDLPGEVDDDEPYDPVFTDGDETRQDSFQVQVRCNPYQEDFDVEDVEVGVEDIELFLSTFSNAVTHPDAFRTCKKGRILVRVTTDQEGPVAVRLWTDVNGVSENEHILTWSSDVGSGVYEAEIERWVSVSESSLLQAMAETVGHVGAVTSTPWKQLPLECSAGPGDKTIEDPPGDDAPSRGGPGGLFSN